MSSRYDEDLTLARLIRKRAQGPDAHRELLAFVGYDEGQSEVVETRSYAQLWDRGCAFAAWAGAQGIGRGARVAVMMQNHPEFVDALVGAAIIGAVVVPIDPRTRGEKLQYQLAHADCAGIVLADYCLDYWRAVRPQVPGIRWALVLDAPSAPAALQDGEHALRELGPAAVPPDHALPANLDACMQLLYTSGTTGNPKAIVGPYAKFAMQGRRVIEYFGVLPTDRMYTGLSMTHANALLISLAGSLYSGVPLVASRKFSKSRLWETIERHRCTTLNLLGGMFTHIFAEPPTPRDAQNPLRMVISAGMPKAIWQEFSERFGVAINEFYGSAEGGSTINRDGAGPVGSCGKPPPEFELMILDDEDLPCPPMAPGEIAFKRVDGAPIRVEYLGNPEASAQKTRGGWLRMGDVGYVDQDGWLFFMHRKGHGIRRNGEFIATAYVEREISRYPGIGDVFVYGVDSGSAGERDIVAALVLDDPAGFDAGELLRFLSSALEPSHVPSYLHLVDSIPKTASEKPLERVLQAAFSRDSPDVVVCARHS